MRAPVPDNELQRLHALHQSGLLESDAEPLFDEFTALAAQVCEVPIAAVSLIDTDCQWLKGAVGLPVSQTSRDISFCAHAILQPGVTIVPDARLDPRFHDNPLVIDAPQIRFYAAAPLRTEDGFALGALCVVDMAPRQIQPSQVKALSSLARQAQNQITLRQHVRTAEWTQQERTQQLAATNAALSKANAALADTNAALAAQIAERIEVEQDLQRVLAQSEQMLAAISSILIGIDAEGHVTAWNAAARRCFGPDMSDVLDRPFRECAIAWDWDRITPALEACRTSGQIQRLEDVLYQRPDGKEAYLGLTLNPIHTHNGRMLGLLLLGVDVTERRALQARLAHAQKMESIGQLAAGVAHEINTPIQYVGDNVRFFQDAVSDLQPLLHTYRRFVRTAAANVPSALVETVTAAEAAADLDYLLSEIPQAVEQSLEGVERVAHIVQAMKEFSHPGTVGKTPINLNHALDSTLTVARNEWKYVAEVQTDFDPALPPVCCLPGEMNQVFLNLIVNAAHAIGDVVGDSGAKGVITVQTITGDGFAEIRVSDTGTGIPEAILGKIFDPFFTTKGVGKGTGQGLAIAHAVVVEKHGGTLAVEGEPDCGATFIIRLPLTDLEETPQAAETPQVSESPCSPLEAV